MEHVEETKKVVLNAKPDHWPMLCQLLLYLQLQIYFFLSPHAPAPIFFIIPLDIIYTPLLIYLALKTRTSYIREVDDEGIFSRGRGVKIKWDAIAKVTYVPSSDPRYVLTALDGTKMFVLQRMNGLERIKGYLRKRSLISDDRDGGEQDPKMQRLVRRWVILSYAPPVAGFLLFFILSLRTK